MGQIDEQVRSEDQDSSPTLDAGKPLHEIGSRIGNYRLLRILDEGGFAAPPRDSRLFWPVAGESTRAKCNTMDCGHAEPVGSTTTPQIQGTDFSGPWNMQIERFSLDR